MARLPASSWTPRCAPPAGMSQTIQRGLLPRSYTPVLGGFCFLLWPLLPPQHGPLVRLLAARPRRVSAARSATLERPGDMAATSDALAAALASLQAELGAQRALIGSLSNRVSELHALVASGGVLPGVLPPPAPPTVQPLAGAAPRTGSDDSAGTAATGAHAPAAAPAATAAGADNPALTAAARPAAAALRLANAAAMLPEYYLREHNGTIAARIVDAAGVFLSVRCGAPGGASAGSTAAAAAALAASLPDGTLLRVHLEREGGPVRAPAAQRARGATGDAVHAWNTPRDAAQTARSRP